MILVTGGTGLLGSHLLYDLLKKNYEVRVLVKHDSDKSLIKKTFSYYTTDSDLLFNELTWIEGDVTNLPSLEDATEGIKEIYHCAAIVSFDPSDEKKMLKVNIEGTANVVNIALEKNIRLCHVSSIAALSLNEGKSVVTENTFWKNSPNNTSYSISKYGAEREVWRGMEEGLNAVIVNPSIIIGPGNWHRGSSVMFSVSYKGLKFYTSGSCNFVDVRDVTKCMITLMEKGIKNERFIISSEDYLFKDFFDLVHDKFSRKKPTYLARRPLTEIGWRLEKFRAALLDRPPVITRETARSSHQRIFVSNEKIKKATGIEFKPIEKSVTEICAFFLKDKGII